jgi:hypothetical protein
LRRLIHEQSTPADAPGRDQNQDERDMTTKLEGPLKRALAIGGDPYVLTITPEGLTLVPKGKRKGYSLAWNAFVSGEAALATALNASLLVAPAKSQVSEKRSRGKPSRKR